MLDEQYIRNGKYSVSLFSLYIVCFDFNIWTWEHIAQASKQPARQNKKKSKDKGSNSKTSALLYAKPTSAHRENQPPLHLLLKEKCG